MSSYFEQKAMEKKPRLPLRGRIDLTYRCNNDCRHCWVRLPAGASEKSAELTVDEIARIAEAARTEGCREWLITGGEPMLRPDFAEIFDLLTRRARAYSINTNGTLITPEIARLMRRKGSKMVAMYGATADVHDHITRRPGSFEAMMRGISYLREAGAGFTVQVVPMKDNSHQYDDMLRLAESLSPHSRPGANWLYLSLSRDPHKNEEIRAQRLSPEASLRLGPYELVEWDAPDLCLLSENTAAAGTRGLFAPCIANRQDFFVDPYGRMTFCQMVSEPALLYDLRKGNFKEAWDVFIPSLIDKVRDDGEYRANCGACERRADCGWCPGLAYLEHGRYTAKIEAMCAQALKSGEFKESRKLSHRRYFQTAGLTICVESDLPIADSTFHRELRLFEVDRPGEDVIRIRHHFQIPDVDIRKLGKEIFRKRPWAIYRNERSFIYLGLPEGGGPGRGNDRKPGWAKVMVFNSAHTKGEIYHDSDAVFRRGNLHSLTLLGTDQNLIARVLADRHGCYFHAAGLAVNGRGLLFIGHSEAGKSTLVGMLRDRTEALSDERVIVRKWPEGFRVHGTWSHGDLPVVSPSSAPLKAVFFLHQAKGNRAVPIVDRRAALEKSLACLIKPLQTADWWDKSLALMGDLVNEVPFYELHFDKSGEIFRTLDLLTKAD
jgi:radical SAM protein with 4Fe4S-binding SPASM domain